MKTLKDISAQLYKKAPVSLTMQEADMCYQAWWQVNVIEGNSEENIKHFMAEDNVWN